MKNWLVVLFAAVLSFSSCSKKNTVEDGTNLPSAADADANAMGDSDTGKAMGLQTIRFGFDGYLLDDEAKSILKGNAQILKDKPSLKIQVEGHCDSRGGIQYNIALGEKRANAVKKFMADQGVAADRISTISMGKEKPVDPGSTEEAHAKNRRANFVVTSR